MNHERQQTERACVGGCDSLGEKLLAMKENLAGHFSWLPRFTEEMEVLETPALMLVNSGLASDTFNVLFWRDAAARDNLRDAISYFHSRELPFTVWCSPRLGEGLAILQELGLRQAESETGMLLCREDFIATNSPAELSIMGVHDAGKLDQFANVLAGIGSAPDSNIVRFFERSKKAMFRKGTPVHIFIGCWNGEAVATCEVFISGRTAGIYNVATREDFRHRGIGAAMTSFGVGEAIRRGCSQVSLQASAMAERVYARLGFQSIFEFATFQEVAG